MEFYRAEFLIENLKNHNEEEEGRRKESEKEYAAPDINSQSSRMMSDMKRQMPSLNASKGLSDFKMPSMPNFKI